jgi:arylsulfatase A-like enzyme
MQDTHPAKPNILWIGVDQMRYDTPGCYGNPVCDTPHLDRLAGQGVLFTDAYAPCSLCTPARASMLTGLYAFKHGMGTNCDLYHALARELPEPGMLLHHRLAALGYRAGFVGKWHVGTQLGPRDYGFEGMNVPGYGDLKREPEFQTYLRENGLTYGAIQDPIYGNPGDKTLIAGRWNGPLESTPTYYLANYAIDLLDRFAGDGRPFFLTCQFWGPHPPYLPSPEYAGRHDRLAIQPWVNFVDDYRGKPESLRRFRPDFYRSLPDDWEGWREIVGLCYDYTTLVDAQIGRILDRLDQLGLANDTLVLFTSDHGDMIGSHGGLFDKGFMYQEAHRVPLIVSWPGRLHPQRRGELVYNMDLMPTVLDILGQPDPGLDGASLLPFLDGAASPAGREDIYLEFHGIRFLYSQRALVTQDGYKYIFTPGDRDEVYDLNRDPGELHNLVELPDYGPLVQRLRQRLMAASAGAGDPIRDYVSKMFGSWENLSGQPEAASPILGQPDIANV